MLTIEEYIAKRKREDKLNEFSLDGDSVSNIESPPPVDQDNLENQSVHVRWNACCHLWADDGGVTEGKIKSHVQAGR